MRVVFTSLLLCLIIFNCSKLFGQSNKSTIRGVVTYFFNEYHGDKPDLGSKVFIVDTSVVRKFDEDLATRFMALKQRKESFKEIDSRCWNNFFELTLKPTRQTTVNAVGEYSVSVKPGVYYVYIVSNNRSTKATMTETVGKVFYKKIMLAADVEEEVSCKFDIFPYDF